MEEAPRQPASQGPEAGQDPSITYHQKEQPNTEQSAAVSAGEPSVDKALLAFLKAGAEAVGEIEEESRPPHKTQHD